MNPLGYYLWGSQVSQEQSSAGLPGTPTPSPEDVVSMQLARGHRLTGQSCPSQPCLPGPLQYQQSSLPHSCFLMGALLERGKEESWCPPETPALRLQGCWSSSHREILWGQASLKPVGEVFPQESRKPTPVCWCSSSLRLPSGNKCPFLRVPARVELAKHQYAFREKGLGKEELGHCLQAFPCHPCVTTK